MAERTAPSYNGARTGTVPPAARQSPVWHTHSVPWLVDIYTCLFISYCPLVWPCSRFTHPVNAHEVSSSAQIHCTATACRLQTCCVWWLKYICTPRTCCRYDLEHKVGAYLDQVRRTCKLVGVTAASEFQVPDQMTLSRFNIKRQRCCLPRSLVLQYDTRRFQRFRSFVFTGDWPSDDSIIAAECLTAPLSHFDAALGVCVTLGSCR